MNTHNEIQDQHKTRTHNALSQVGSAHENSQPVKMTDIAKLIKHLFNKWHFLVVNIPWESATRCRKQILDVRARNFGRARLRGLSTRLALIKPIGEKVTDQLPLKDMLG